MGWGLEITLPDSGRDFVEQQVVKGGYQTASDYIETLVREAQSRDTGSHPDASLLERLDHQGAEALTPRDWEQLRELDPRRHFEELRRAIAVAQTQMERGEHAVYNSESVKDLIEEVKTDGRSRLGTRDHQSRKAQLLR